MRVYASRGAIQRHHVCDAVAVRDPHRVPVDDPHPVSHPFPVADAVNHRVSIPLPVAVAVQVALAVCVVDAVGHAVDYADPHGDPLRVVVSVALVVCDPHSVREPNVVQVRQPVTHAVRDAHVERDAQHQRDPHPQRDGVGDVVDVPVVDPHVVAVHHRHPLPDHLPGWRLPGLHHVQVSGGGGVAVWGRRGGGGVGWGRDLALPPPCFPPRSPRSWQRQAWRRRAHRGEARRRGYVGWAALAHWCRPFFPLASPSHCPLPSWRGGSLPPAPFRVCGAWG